MSRFVDGLRVPTTIFEAAVWHHTIRVACRRCTNLAVFEAAAIWWHFHGRHHDLRIRDAHERFYCLGCSRGGDRLRPRPLQLVKDAPTRVLPLPDDRTWKRALSRFKT